MSDHLADLQALRSITRIRRDQMDVIIREHPDADTTTGIRAMRTAWEVTLNDIDRMITALLFPKEKAA